MPTKPNRAGNRASNTLRADISDIKVAMARLTQAFEDHDKYGREQLPDHERRIRRLEYVQWILPLPMLGAVVGVLKIIL